MRKLNQMTDEELALAYVEGDNKAFDLLLSRCEGKAVFLHPLCRT